MQDITKQEVFHKTTYISIIISLIVFLTPIMYLMLNDNVVEHRTDIPSVIEQTERKEGRDV